MKAARSIAVLSVILTAVPRCVAQNNDSNVTASQCQLAVIRRFVRHSSRPYKWPMSAPGDRRISRLSYTVAMGIAGRQCPVGWSCRVKWAVLLNKRILTKNCQYVKDHCLGLLYSPLLQG